jgi:hypothetical protein
MRVYKIDGYFSRVCLCWIPAHWRTEQAGRYGDGETREEAIATLRRNLGHAERVDVGEGAP